MAKNDTPADDEVVAPAWPKVIDWSGLTFTIPNPEDWPVGALRAFERGHQIDALARLLGAGWAQIEDLPVSKLRPLFDKIAEVSGFTDSGE